MLTKETIEEPRTPSALRDFVSSVKAEVRGDASERPTAHVKQGLYKQFLDELVPLSVFCKEHYGDDVYVQLLCGNQPFDAIVRDVNGREIEKIEITSPDDGSKTARRNRQLAQNGITEMDVYDPGEDLEALKAFIIDTCRKKAEKDYSDCLLVISVAYMPPYETFHEIYDKKVSEIADLIAGTTFNAKNVFLLILNEHRKIEISS